MLNLTLSQIFEGYLLEAQARRLSSSTIRTYTDAYNKLQTSLAADLPFNEITSNHIRTCLAQQDVSKKSLYNYHVALSAIWTWAIREELASDHILKRVQRSKPEQPAIIPYSRKDIPSGTPQAIVLAGPILISYSQCSISPCSCPAKPSVSCSPARSLNRPLSIAASSR